MTPRMISFSPRPWGWTATAEALDYLNGVFPTPVGMDRVVRTCSPPRKRFPHARGDGPLDAYVHESIHRFSPRPWGWTVRDDLVSCRAVVFPTPVGMDRYSSRSLQRLASFPHARGDGPELHTTFRESDKFSPRPWGWTVLDAAAHRLDTVFPTPVGMDRGRGVHRQRVRGFPHARGDGPPCVSSLNKMAGFSPRPWGWTGAATLFRAGDDVFPTPVGMDRYHPRLRRGITRFPHARGDGPFLTRPTSSRIRFSPRPWGWTDENITFSYGRKVFPTPVGMDRAR